MTDRDLRRPPVRASEQMPALVLGATSIVGRFLVDRLVDAQVHTTAVSRRARAAQAGVEWVTSDLAGLQLGLEPRPRIAFSAAPIWLLGPALPVLATSGVVRLVAFSSTSRFTKTKSPIPSEREVVRRLIEGETEIRTFCEANDIAWTILRPTVIYAEGEDRSITRLANLIRRVGVLPLAGDAHGKRQPVHADDLAAGAIAAARLAATMNRAYNLPGGETLTYRSMCERIFEGMGRRSRIVSIPPMIWRLGLSVAAQRMPGITTEMGSRMAEDLTFDSTDAQRDFEWRPRGFRPRFHLH